MYYQSKTGFYTYHYDCMKVLNQKYYPTLEDFFRTHSEFYIKSIVEDNIFAYINKPIDKYYFVGYATVIYDECGNLYTKDRILGLYRNWKSKRDIDWDKYHNSLKRHRYCYGKFRKIKTFQECKKSLDIDPEYKITCRPSRNKANLPNDWDDYMTSPNKCWKYQRKTKHQYKIK